MGILAVVEDHPFVRDSILEAVSSVKNFDEVVFLDSADEIAELKKPEYLITDLNLPGGPILSILRKFAYKNPECKIIIFSAFLDRLSKKFLEQVDVYSLISKNTPTPTILSTFETLFHGSSVDCPRGSAIRKSCDSLDINDDDISEILSNAEYSIFKLLAENKSLDQISKIKNISPKTASNHKYWIMKKLNVHSLAGLVYLGKKIGY